MSYARDGRAPLPPGTSVEWNADGSYTPICELCSWQGKRRARMSLAREAARSHARSRRHKGLA